MASASPHQLIRIRTFRTKSDARRRRFLYNFRRPLPLPTLRRQTRFFARTRGRKFSLVEPHPESVEALQRSPSVLTGTRSRAAALARFFRAPQLNLSATASTSCRASSAADDAPSATSRPPCRTSQCHSAPIRNTEKIAGAKRRAFESEATGFALCEPTGFHAFSTRRSVPTWTPNRVAISARDLPASSIEAASRR